ncbi:MAG: hypothetical protein ACLFSY_00415 [Desulfonatronovibrionaceae bacterium]
MGIDDFFANDQLTKLLNLPEGMRASIFASKRLSGDEKFVLANLYLLDAYGKLDRFAELLPQMTKLEREKINSAIDSLARHRLINREKQRITLKIRPMDYKKCLPEKTSRK